MQPLFYGFFKGESWKQKMVEANDDGQVSPKSIAKPK